MEMPDLKLVAGAFHRDDADAVRNYFEAYPGLKAHINEPIGPFDSPPILGARSRAMIDVLLDAGADINGRSKWWAGSFGLLDSLEPDLAEYAISRGARLDAHSAARLGKIDELRIMLDENPELVHARGGDGQLPLHFASTIPIADLLLDRGADINARDIDHVSTAAQWMVKSRQNVARHLIEKGAETDILMLSALGDLPRVRALLDADPDSIRMRVSDEFFPLAGGENGGTIYQWELGWHVSAHQVAKRFGHGEVLQLLLERSPRDVQVAAACWLGLDVPEGTVDFGPVERRQLAHAARNNEVAVVRRMLAAGFPVDARSQHGGTALHWAAWHGNAGLIRLLLSQDFDLEDKENNFLTTPLSWAIYASVNGWNRSADFVGSVQELLGAGAEVPAEYGGSDEVRAAIEAYKR